METEVIDILDIYDANRKKTGKTIGRFDNELKDGEYVLCAHAIIMNSKKQLLVSKRSQNKKRFPGFWEMNGGLCMTGESSLQGINREIQEELGIDLTNCKKVYFREFKGKEIFDDHWIFKTEVELKNFKPNDEVDEAKWVTFDEYSQMCKESKFAHGDRFTIDDYNKCVNLLFSSET